ncbi:MAG: hypothetical protein ABIE22_00710 [archaeon]
MRKLLICVLIVMLVLPLVSADFKISVADSYFENKRIARFPNDGIIPTPVDLECGGEFRIKEEYQASYNASRGDKLRASFQLLDKNEGRVYGFGKMVDCDVSGGLDNILCNYTFKDLALPRSNTTDAREVKCGGSLFLTVGATKKRIGSSLMNSSNSLKTATDVYYFVPYYLDYGSDFNYDDVASRLDLFLGESGYTDSGRLMGVVVFNKTLFTDSGVCNNPTDEINCMLDNLEYYFRQTGIKLPVSDDVSTLKKVDKVIGVIPEALNLDGEFVEGAAMDRGRYVYGLSVLDEEVMAHELGHLYGLGHPGETNEYNIRDVCCDSPVLGATNCLESDVGACGIAAGELGTEDFDKYCVGERVSGDVYSLMTPGVRVRSLADEGCVSDPSGYEFVFDAPGPDKLADLFLEAFYPGR